MDRPGVTQADVEAAISSLDLATVADTRIAVGVVAGA
jgi:hypothetical protein